MVVKEGPRTLIVQQGTQGGHSVELEEEKKG